MLIEEHIKRLSNCNRCPDMIGPVITGEPLYSKVMSVGQAPGIHEGKLQRPFAWTAGKTLFKWFETINVDEEEYRKRVYMAAVCRCFPGKNTQGGKSAKSAKSAKSGKSTKGGDRVPNKVEIKACSHWLQKEYRLLQPELIIPIGKLAMQQYLEFKRLTEVVGVVHQIELNQRGVDVIPLPHPSGVSTWFRTEPGKDLLKEALQLISEHSAWVEVFQSEES